MTLYLHEALKILEPNTYIPQCSRQHLGFDFYSFQKDKKNCLVMLHAKSHQLLLSEKKCSNVIQMH